MVRIALLALLTAAAAVSHADLFAVSVESALRRTAAGDDVAYDLYIPVAQENAPQPPWPAVVLTHGFARSKSYHANNARYLAERGIITLTPNMTSLLGGDSSQLRNIDNTVDHVVWLRSRGADPNDSLFGLVDSARIGLAGHSAGGAVSFEAAVECQTRLVPLSAVCLLDAVPWDRTITRAASLKPLSFASVRSEPSSCNANGSVVGLLNAVVFPTDDIRVVGATHCDPENPTDWQCTLFCGGTSSQRRGVYQRLLYLFFQDAFKLRSVEPSPTTFWDAVRQYEGQGSISLAPKPARTVGSISAAKSLPDESRVRIAGVVVSAGSDAFAQQVYVAGLGEPSGLQVLCIGPAQCNCRDGDVVDAEGVLRTMQGERVLVFATVSQTQPDASSDPQTTREGP